MPAIDLRSAGMDRDLLRLMEVLLAGAWLALLDTSMISVAIDDLTRAFDTTVATAQWATTGYLLAMAAAIPMMGWLTDRWGTKRVWLVTLWLFLLGSVLCAAAWSIESLIAFRAVQGLGGGLILPLVQAILSRAAGPQRIGRAMGLVGIPGQLAPILGPVLGGIVLGALGWRWIFLINVPLCLLALLLAARHLQVAEYCCRTQFDWIGVLLLIPAIVAILVGLSATDESATFSGHPIALLSAGVVLLGGFVLYARRRGDRALLDLTLLRHRSFAVATVMMFISGICVYGPMLLLPLFYLRARGLTMTEVGLLLAPQGLGMMAALWAAGRWADQIGPRLVALAGVFLAGAGLAVFAAAGAAPIGYLSAGLVALGAGLGAIGVATAATSYRDIDPDAISKATSLLNVVQRIGASSGTVVIALILQQQLAAIGTPARQGAIDAAFAHTFTWALGFLVVALVVALFLPATPPHPPTPTDIRHPESRTAPCAP